VRIMTVDKGDAVVDVALIEEETALPEAKA